MTNLFHKRQVLLGSIFLALSLPASSQNLVVNLVDTLSPLTDQGMDVAGSLLGQPLIGVASTLIDNTLGPDAAISPIVNPLINVADEAYGVLLAPVTTGLTEVLALPGL